MLTQIEILAPWHVLNSSHGCHGTSVQGILCADHGRLLRHSTGPVGGTMNPYNTHTLITGTKAVEKDQQDLWKKHPNNASHKSIWIYAIKTALIPSNRLRCDHPWLNFLMIVPVETVQKHWGLRKMNHNLVFWAFHGCRETPPRPRSYSSISLSFLSVKILINSKPLVFSCRMFAVLSHMKRYKLLDGFSLGGFRFPLTRLLGCEQPHVVSELHLGHVWWGFPLHVNL